MKGGGQSPAGDFLMQQDVLPWMFNRAKGVANMPFTPYTGQLSAGRPAALDAAEETARRTGSHWYQPVEGARMGSVPNVSAGMGFGGMQDYMNPYLQNVVDTSLSDIDRSRRMAVNQNESNATTGGAFNNDRLGVENAQTNEGYGRIAANTAAGLRMGGFNTAAGLAMSDADRALRAAQGNQQVGFGTNQQNALLGQQANLANQGAGLEGMRTQLDSARALSDIGGMRFGMEQEGYNRAYEDFLRRLALPYQQQDVLIKSLGGFGNAMGGQWSPKQAVNPGNLFGFNFAL